MLLNQYSFIWVGLSLLFLATLTIWRYYGMKSSLVAATLILLVLLLLQLVLSTKNNEINTIVEFQKEVNAKQPIFIMMYSDYWIGCLAAKPFVDRFEGRIGNNGKVLRINFQSNLGRHVREKYHIKVVPTYVVLDHNGIESWRGTTTPSVSLMESLGW